jgi:hypothetical protein
MIQRIVHITPIQAGKVAAIYYGILGVIFSPFLMLPALLGAKDAFPVWVPLVVVPLYVLGGFVMTVVMAWLYNLIAGWVGGIEVTLQSQPGA